MTDYSTHLYHFVGTRKHFFKDVRYNIYIFDNFMVMGERPLDPKPKYRIDFKLEIQIQFILDRNVKKSIRMTAFAFKYHERYKEMATDHEHIVKMKELIANKVTFYKIADFYDPQYIIGKGSSARVLLVQKLHDPHKYAVKSIDKAYLFKSENGMEAFQSEVHILNLLSATNTEQSKLFLKLFEIFEGDLTYYLVVELMQGKTLQDELDAIKSRKDRSIMKPENTRVIMRKLLQGVKIMHDANIIHRDLKPDNIMFASHGDYSSLRIVDFGLATETTVERYMFPKCGTPGYVAPEVLNLANRSEKYSPICDLFSCGCIFYKLLTGRSLFPGTQFNEVLKLNKACEIDLSSNPDLETVSPEALNLLVALLQKDPTKRINSDEALQHPYLADANSPLNSNQLLSGNVLTGQIEIKFSQDIEKINIQEQEMFSPFQKRAVNGGKCAFKLHKVEEDKNQNEEDSNQNKEENLSDEVMQEFFDDSSLQIQQLPYFKKPGLSGSRCMPEKRQGFANSVQQSIDQIQTPQVFSNKDIQQQESPDKFSGLENLQKSSKITSPTLKSPLNQQRLSMKQSTVNSFYMKEPLSGMKKHKVTYRFINQQQTSPERDTSKEKQRQSKFLDKLPQQPPPQQQFMEQVSLFNRQAPKNK